MGINDTVRLSDGFINKTSQDINIYEQSSGRIRTFSPSMQLLPRVPNRAQDGPVVYYILDQHEVERLRDDGRSLYDVAFVDRISYGRNGIPIAYLVWAQDPKVSVRLRFDTQAQF